MKCESPFCDLPYIPKMLKNKQMPTGLKNFKTTRCSNKHKEEERCKIFWIESNGSERFLVCYKIGIVFMI